MTAAETFTSAAAEIVTRTGCTVDQALSYLVNKMATERPELLVKVILTAPVAA